MQTRNSMPASVEDLSKVNMVDECVNGIRMKNAFWGGGGGEKKKKTKN